MAKRLKVGILGAGRIGAVHALALSRNAEVELRWIYDPFIFIKVAKAVQEKTGVAIAESADQLIEDDAVNLYEGWLVLEAEQDPTKAPPLEYATKGYRHIRALLDG